MALSTDARAGLIGTLAGAVLGGVVGIAGTLIGVDKTADRQEQFLLPGQVSIDTVEGARSIVGRTVELKGTADIPGSADRTLWIVVRVDVNGVTAYYPQGRAEPDEAGHWSCVVSLGSSDPADDGPYAALAVLVDGSTSKAFRKYVNEELATDHDGMADYPADANLRMDWTPLERDMSL